MTLQNYLEHILNMHFSPDAEVQAHLKAAQKRYTNVRFNKPEVQGVEESIEHLRNKIAHASSTDTTSRAELKKDIESFLRNVADQLLRERLEDESRKEEPEK